jgi:hypothetical protein
VHEQLVKLISDIEKLFWALFGKHHHSNMPHKSLLPLVSGWEQWRGEEGGRTVPPSQAQQFFVVAEMDTAPRSTFVAT